MCDVRCVMCLGILRYQIQKYHLKGPKAGTSELFMENLPGFPDNINLGEDGLFWIGLFLVREKTVLCC